MVQENRPLVVRNAEARGSIPLCSTNNSLVASELQPHQNPVENFIWRDLDVNNAKVAVLMRTSLFVTDWKTQET